MLSGYSLEIINQTGKMNSADGLSDRSDYKAAAEAENKKKQAQETCTGVLEEARNSESEKACTGESEETHACESGEARTSKLEEVCVGKSNKARKEVECIDAA
jgi:hypothetical protein